MRRLMVVPVLWLVGGGCAGKVTTDRANRGHHHPAARRGIRSRKPGRSVSEQPAARPRNRSLGATSPMRRDARVRRRDAPRGAESARRIRYLQGRGDRHLQRAGGPELPGRPCVPVSGRPLRVPTDGSEGPIPLDVTLGHSFRAARRPRSSTTSPCSRERRWRGRAPTPWRCFGASKTATGAELQPSVTWALVRQSTEPVQFSSTGSGDVQRHPLRPHQSRRSHDAARARSALEGACPGASVLRRRLPPVLTGMSAPVPRDEVLLAWSFNTETISDPFDRGDRQPRLAAHDRDGARRPQDAADSRGWRRRHHHSRTVLRQRGSEPSVHAGRVRRHRRDLHRQLPGYRARTSSRRAFKRTPLAFRRRRCPAALGPIRSAT